MVVRRIAAPAERVLAAAAEPITTGFADPTTPEISGGVIRWSSASDVADEVERTAEVSPTEDGSILTISARTRFAMPYFAWLFRPLIAWSVRRSLRHMADVIEARATGRMPLLTRRHFWLPNDRLPHTQAATIATICAVLVVSGYGSSLFTQTLDYLAKTYGASDANLGVALAVTRVGVFVGLVGAALADRRGRRRILLVGIAGTCIATALSALAPNLTTFTAMQILVRGFAQVTGVVGYIAITEEAPEGSRAFLLAVAGMATGAGFAVAAGLLPIADVSAESWRYLYAAGALGLLFLPGLARRLPETTRYAAMSARAAGASAGELVDRIYGVRFAIAAAIGFLLGFFGSPSLQFTNRYLSDVRGYTGPGILWLRSLTQGAPALFAILLGGKLAESRGRKPIATQATLALGIASAAFFLTGGFPLGMAMLVATVVGAMGGPAMTSFNTELFPTEVRGRAGAVLLAVSVAGSAAGLLLVGYLADPLGDVGKAVAVTCIAPIIVALFLIPRLPEARGRALDEVSPPEV